MKWLFWLVITAAMSLAVGAEEARLLDDFEDVSIWQARPADGVTMRLSPAPGSHGQALRFDFRFDKGGGYAVARRPIDFDFPENFELSFRLQGEAPVNNLEIKLVDAAGENVWWVNRRDFVFPREWSEVRLKKRHFEFAWGPTADKTLRHAAALELVVTAGSGGEGTVFFDQLTFTPLPAEQPYAGGAVSWSSEEDGRRLVADLGEPRAFGGITFEWAHPEITRSYHLELSEDGRQWFTVRRVEGGWGRRDALFLPESEARFVRLVLDSPAELSRFVVEPLAFGASKNAFFESLAARAPRGEYPRGFVGEQSYWTVVGVDGDREEGLLSEDGALEVGKGRFSIEPFVMLGEERLDWSRVETTQTLTDGDLPIPVVSWRHPRLTLELTALAAGEAGASSLEARYRVTNTTHATLAGTLVLAIRPFQVNPPTQFLNTAGGTAEVRSVEIAAHRVTVNGDRVVEVRPAPDRAGAVPFHGGSIVEHLSGGALPAARRVEDPIGHASGALAYELELAPGASRIVELAVPFHGVSPVVPSFDTALTAARASWRTRLDAVGFRVPAEAQHEIETLKTALAHILINRDGAGLQPGSRSYERSWIRDGALTSEALLRLGQGGVVRSFLDWYAPFQYENGKVPCCVDARGADPVPEHDSHGELIFLIAETYRYTKDRAQAERHWPRVLAAARFLEELTATRRTPEFERGEKHKFFGLLPESISHEGYSAKPMHSYWDGFWGLKGLKDAAWLAAELGHTHEAAKLAALRDRFARDLYASLEATRAEHGISYLPGCAELGDFDATSTTIALAPGGEQARLPKSALLATFERYWKEFVARRDGGKEWDAYTPYELRTVGTFVRLGWRERATELLDFFYRDRRPLGWRQWAEVVGREVRKSRFVGDMPHTWVASDFIRSFLDRFAYEREEDESLVVTAGLPREWLAGPEGVAIDGLRTPYGPLSYEVESVEGTWALRIEGGMALPRGGIVVPWPFDGEPRPTTVNGRPVCWGNGELVIRSLPAEIIVRTTPHPATE